jgi:hypothetical protein
MFEFFVADMNTGFAIALASVFVLGLLEGLGLLIGLSVMNLMDQVSPFELDVDINTDVSGDGLTPLLGWLCLNRLPLLIWAVLFLTSFAIAGYTFNFVLLSSFSIALPSFVAYILAFIIAILMTGWIGKPLAMILPKNESSAVSSHSFTGRIAKITIGTAKKDSPAQAVLIDQFNQKHYVLVAPDDSNDTFNQSEEVVLVEKTTNHWLAVKFTQ